MTNPTAAATRTPVSSERVGFCLASAAFWVDELPRYADRQQQKADLWAIGAGVLSAFTSLSIWPLLSESKEVPALVFLSAVSLAAAICALIPRVKNYAELAGQARELTSRYGSLKGELTDLAVLRPLDQDRAQIVLDEFDATKQKKDALRGLPDRAKREAELADTARLRAEARERAARAEESAARAEKAGAEAEQAARLARESRGPV
jgi:hypothetical protein